MLIDSIGGLITSKPFWITVSLIWVIFVGKMFINETVRQIEEFIKGE